MDQFVQPLESRRLLSAAALPAAEAKLATDVETIITDAKDAKTTLVDDTKPVVEDLKALHIKNTPLGKALSKTLSSSGTVVKADVSHIVSIGMKDGETVFSDWLKTMADASNPTQLVKDQTKLATDVQKLWNVEKPSLDKLESDLDSSLTKVENAAQAIVTANKSDTALVASWTTLEGALNSSKTTLTNDFSDLTVDVNALIADI